MTEMEQRIQTAKKPQGDQGTATLERMNQSHQELTLWALEQLQGEFTNILDVGCGGGATLGRLMEKYPTATVYGVDYSPEGVALSKQNNQSQLGKRCHIQEGSVLQLPYGENQFGLITAFETIYFWQDYPTALAEIRRVLQPGGVFLVCCEMSDPENPRWQEALPLMKILPGAGWKTLLEQQGFSSVVFTQGAGEWICLVAQQG